MPAISEATASKFNTLSEVYGEKINSDNEFLITLIAELMAKVDSLEEITAQLIAQGGGN